MQCEHKEIWYSGSTRRLPAKICGECFRYLEHNKSKTKYVWKYGDYPSGLYKSIEDLKLFEFIKRV